MGKRFDFILLAAGLALVICAPFAAWQAHPYHQEVITGMPVPAAGLLLLRLSRKETR